MSCDSQCSVACPHGAIGWYAVVIVVSPDHTHLLSLTRTGAVQPLSPSLFKAVIKLKYLKSSLQKLHVGFDKLSWKVNICLLCSLLIILFYPPIAVQLFTNLLFVLMCI